MSDTELDPENIALTSEGAPELDPAAQTAAVELLREQGAVLRLPEGPQLDATDLSLYATHTQTMITNLGPQHPSPHGSPRPPPAPTGPPSLPPWPQK